jgi:small-conductance mechanosensitive channel
VLTGAVALAVFVWIANVVLRLIDQRLRCFAPLTPVVQVLASKLARMTLLSLAVVLALGSIGIDQTAFAVFSAAIGVGVGFGLQRVVFNLVSGVILLLDRSIKPGDVIEIDNTYGSVTERAIRLCADARWQGISDSERGPDHRACHQLVILQRPRWPPHQGWHFLSVRSA